MARNSEHVHPDNFREVAGTDLTLSRMIYGTGNGVASSPADFLQYNALKHSLMSGGINHIDTSSSFRR
jgi:aryl-alcohol dehydrogenase-like predicted oxidoreductase